MRFRRVRPRKLGRRGGGRHRAFQIGDRFRQVGLDRSRRGKIFGGILCVLRFVRVVLLRSRGCLIAVHSVASSAAPTAPAPAAAVALRFALSRAAFTRFLVDIARGRIGEAAGFRLGRCRNIIVV